MRQIPVPLDQPANSVGPRVGIKPGIAPKPFVPIRYDPGGSTVPARHPRRANAKELRRAYDRARQELKMIELEAQPENKLT